MKEFCCVNQSRSLQKNLKYNLVLFYSFHVLLYLGWTIYAILLRMKNALTIAWLE